MNYIFCIIMLKRFPIQIAAKGKGYSFTFLNFLFLISRMISLHQTQTNPDPSNLKDPVHNLDVTRIQIRIRISAWKASLLSVQEILTYFI